MVNYYENVLERRGTSGRDHIPALPFWLAIVRIFQLIFAFIVLVLTAYSSNAFGGSSSGSVLVNDFFPGYSMSFFTFAWTVLFLLYIFLTPLALPKFYHSLAHIGLEFLTVVFWLTTFALLADESDYWKSFQDAYSKYKELDDSGELDKALTACKASRAATGIACIVWLLFSVTFGFVVYFWNKHRAEHGGTGFSFGGYRGPTNNPEAEKTHAPVELHNVQGQPQYPPTTAQV